MRWMRVEDFKPGIRAVDPNGRNVTIYRTDSDSISYHGKPRNILIIHGRDEKGQPYSCMADLTDKWLTD